jgi:hypothetical protein
MERADPQLHWPTIRGPKITPNHIFYAAAAALPILALMSNAPASWWVQSGFQSYPGTFVRIAEESYPLCRPWREPDPGAHREAGVHVAARSGMLAGKAQTNLAVLLPKNAEVTAIYCGAAPDAAPLKDCSVLKCPMAAHMQFEDSVFTRGRGVEFSVRNLGAAADARARFGFWVLWREPTA